MPQWHRVSLTVSLALRSIEDQIMRVAIVIVALFLAHSAHAANDGPAAMEFFAGVCFHTIDDLGRVRGMATTFGWNELPEDMAKVMKPVEGTDFTGWVAKSRELGAAIVSTNKGKWIDGRKANVCSTILQINPQDAINILQIEFGAQLIQSNKEPFQTMNIYKANSSVVPALMITLLFDPKGRPPVNITAFGILD